MEMSAVYPPDGFHQTQHPTRISVSGTKIDSGIGSWIRSICVGSGIQDLNSRINNPKSVAEDPKSRVHSVCSNFLYSQTYSTCLYHFDKAFLHFYPDSSNFLLVRFDAHQMIPRKKIKRRKKLKKRGKLRVL